MTITDREAATGGKNDKEHGMTFPEPTERYRDYLDAQKPKWETERKKRATRERKYAKMVAAIWADPPWQPMTSCPFAILDHLYGYEDSIVVRDDGKNIALVTVKQRFGTPIRWKIQPTMQMDVVKATVDGCDIEYPMMRLVGGEQEKIDAPKWWFKWELIDQNGLMNYAGGEETGKDEIDFIPTAWMPLPGTNAP